MSHRTFSKVEKSEKRMFGPQVLIVCGYLTSEQSSLLALLEQNDLTERPIIFVTGIDMDKVLKEVIALPDRSGLGEHSNMRRAIIMSGFTQNELHKLMSAYRNSGLPAQLWATLTPVSENWTIKELLEELAAEREAMNV